MSKQIVVLASEPAGGRSRATGLPCCYEAIYTTFIYTGWPTKTIPKLTKMIQTLMIFLVKL